MMAGVRRHAPAPLATARGLICRHGFYIDNRKQKDHLAAANLLCSPHGG
jgi:hypothetical protein